MSPVEFLHPGEVVVSPDLLHPGEVVVSPDLLLPERSLAVSLRPT